MDLYEQIAALATDLGFADFGCAKADALSYSETKAYNIAASEGLFGNMEYLLRNRDKREDPTLLLPGAKSVLVFLIPFSLYGGGNEQNRQEVDKRARGEGRVRISEFALGNDYHTVIKKRLNKIANFIDRCQIEREDIKVENNAIIQRVLNPNYVKYKSLCCRVFVDSAPIMERSWALRAGLGFIGKNNFLISKRCGVKNFIGVILTTAELSYNETVANNRIAPDRDICGSCNLCIEACSQNALFAPRRIDARKCLSYKTIEAPIEDIPLNRERAKGQELEVPWIFGCDDCMNACPWNRLNIKGWQEFHTNADLLRSSSLDAEAALGERAEWWNGLSQEDFDKLFKDSPLRRAGLEKIKQNIRVCYREH